MDGTRTAPDRSTPVDPATADTRDTRDVDTRPYPRGMPLVDKETGKRLSGAAQRRLAALRRQPAEQPPEPKPKKTAPAPHRAAVHQALAAIKPPPLGDVTDVESWATMTALAVAVAGREGEDPDRLRIVRKGLRAIGQLRDKGRRAAKAAELLKLRCGETHDLTAEEPPANPMTAAAWAYFRLAALVHSTLTAANPHAFAEQLEDLSTVGFVPSKGAIDAMTARLRGG